MARLRTTAATTGTAVPSYGGAYGGTASPTGYDIPYDEGQSGGGWDEKVPGQPDPTYTPVPAGTHTPYEEGGVTGGQKTSAGSVGQYAHGPVDLNKWNDPNKHDAKYDMMRIESKYDPTKGISDDLLKELDSLGYFQGLSTDHGQHLSWSGVTDAGRAAGLDPHGFSGDFITGWGQGKNPGAMWGYDWYDPNAGQQAGPGSGGINQFLQQSQGYGSGGGQGGGGGYGGGSASSSFPGLAEALKGLFGGGGAFNQGATNARLDNARDTLNRQRKSQMQTNGALLGERGITQQEGAAQTAQGNLEDRMYQSFVGGANDIFADESHSADQRMMQALQMATGLSQSDAQNMVDMARINSDEKLGWGNIGLGYQNADINRTLGLGNLALGNTNAANSYNLGLGRLGLDRDTAINNSNHMSMDEMLQLLGLYLHGADTSTNGYIPK